MLTTILIVLAIWFVLAFIVAAMLCTPGRKVYDDLEEFKSSLPSPLCDMDPHQPKQHADSVEHNNQNNRV